MKIKTIAIFLLIIGSAFLVSHLEAIEDSSLTQAVNSKVLRTIEHSDSIPGLKEKEFIPLKGEITNIWNTLITENVLELSGTDAEVRPYFVALQAIIELVLSDELQNEVSSLEGFIHTPMPTTALCTKGEISPTLVDPKIAADPRRLLTVKARPEILRGFLSNGGKLYVVYPEGGLEKRSKLQQEVYKQALSTYPNLYDIALQGAFPEDVTGATYFFEDNFGHTFVFAIKMTQAKDPKESGYYGLWFGPIDHPAIQKRVDIISKYMKENGADLSDTKIR